MRASHDCSGIIDKLKNLTAAGTCLSLSGCDKAPPPNIHAGFHWEKQMAKRASSSRRNSKSNDTGLGAGHGGETHQSAARTGEVLTTNQGIPISDNQNSLKSGARGPTLLEDFVLREKITHFDHERIPERIVHARGIGRARLLPAVRSRSRS